MCSITLLGTNHAENGLANSNELYRIIEKVNPEVIFEEIPPICFESYYITKKRSNLETETINLYLEKYSIKHVPVDIYNVSDSFFKNTAKVHEKVERKSRKYRQLIDENKYRTGKYGFKYLNSVDCEELQAELSKEILETVKEINDANLIQYWNTWVDVEESRDLKMIENIYNYSMSNEFEIGLFTIGAAHRKSIIRKIENNVLYKNIQWKYHDYENIF